MTEPRELSIDEMNKLRAELGLPPLAAEEQDTKNEKKLPIGAEDDEEVYVDLAQKRRDEEQAQQEKERKQAAKMEKMYQGPTLSEIVGHATSAADWVKKSRIEEAAKKRKERVQAENDLKKFAEETANYENNFGKTSQVLQASEQSNKPVNELTGVAVAHRPDQLMEQGDEVILTLKDSNVLDDNGDVLENVDLAAEERRRKNKEAARKKSRYEEYEDANKGWFPQWEEERDTDHDFVISADGSIIQSNKNVDDSETIKKRLLESTNEVLASIEAEKPKQSSDYYTADEMAKFRRPKKTAKTDKKKNARRKKPKRSLAELLGDDADTVQDHGKRNEEASAQLAEASRQTAFEQRQRSYDQALATASQTSGAILGAADGEPRATVSMEAGNGEEVAAALAGSTAHDNREESVLLRTIANERASGKQEVVSRKNNDEALFVDEDDVLYNSIAAVRKKAIAGRNKRAQEDLNTVVERALESRDKVNAESANNETLALQDYSSKEGGKDGIILTAAERFIRTITPPEKIRRLARADEDASASVASARRSADNAMPEQAFGDEALDRTSGLNDAEKRTVSGVTDANTDTNASTDNSGSGSDSDEDGTVVGMDEDLGAGLGNVLKLMCQTGELKGPRTADMVTVKGRKNDEVTAQTPGEEVLFEYRDEKNRLLSKHEAFRVLAHKFHGRKPGKRKQEKLAQREEEERMRQSAPMNDTANSAAAAMRRAQVKTHQAHFDLSFSANSIGDISLNLTKKDKRKK